MAHEATTPNRRPIALAFTAAALFGLSTPAAKWLLATTDPWVLAGLLYLGSGIGLGGLWLIGRAFGGVPREAPLRRHDVPWLAGAVVSGGVVGPVLLMFGLAVGSASQAALLLNLEGVLTAMLAWSIFREQFDARIAAGMGLIAAGAAVLAWPTEGTLRASPSALLVAGACLSWAIDNNLTRRVSGGDPMLIASLKGGAAGTVSLAIAAALGAQPPRPAAGLGGAIVGLLGYGISLVLFVRALRDLGAARTGAYFSTAPFIGAVVSVAALGEPLTARLAAGAALMGLGVWLHIRERHVHEHVHEALDHEHLHRHDEHHRHEHDADTPAGEPHSHRHLHATLAHGHPHYPDLHHRHGHRHP